MNSILSEAGAYIAEIAAKKADYADLYLQSGTNHSILFEDGRMDTVSSSIGDGAGARVVKGENTIYAHSIGAGASSALGVLGEAAALAGLNMTIPEASADEPLFEVPGRAVIPQSLDSAFFHDLDRALRSETKLLKQATFRFRTSVKSVLIIKGDGSVARDDRHYTSFAVQVVAGRDGDLQTGYESRSLLADAEAFWSGACADDAAEIAHSALRRALLMLEARPCPAGVMSVLMDGTAGGTMIHEACGHSLEADIVQKDFSVFRDRTGQLVANPLVTIVDDATLPGRYGSYAFDDEGTSARETVLVENGILKNYLTDILSARVGGLPLSGNGRRESYRNQPIPRMSNTFIAPGETERGEMLDRVRRGLLVSKMGGGEVNPTSGDFVFYVSEGYLIENGKVGAAVKGATLTGNGPEALRKIIAVGRELVLDQGMCGKSGQGVPVTDGQPTLLIEDLIVGGCDTNDGR